ncbi:MAG: HAMP domain-containing histidine kinase [Bacteroidales bacterium]|jgi:signal transduction histidine kinase|nr:HAMP domain-containing histidine kinase [Bacteroidales bacterium]
MTSRIKYCIFIFATLTIAALFLLLNRTISNIKREERKQVLLWAEAIQKRNAIVEHSNQVFTKLQEDERRKIDMWSEAQRLILQENDSHFLSYLLKVISSNKNIPIILTDPKGKVVSTANLNFDLALGEAMPAGVKAEFSHYEPIAIQYGNTVINYLYYSDSHLFSELHVIMNNMIASFIDEVVRNSASVPVVITTVDTLEVIACGNIADKEFCTIEKQREKIARMMESNTPIPIMLNGTITHYIFYEDSTLLTRLRFYPALFLLVIVLLVVLAYMMYYNLRRNEQTQLLVGMSKETAHQLGTPISSLMAWVELLKEEHVNPDIIGEINKDVLRLQVVADRFSKIGAKPVLTPENLNEIVENVLAYLRLRTSNSVHFTVFGTQKSIIAPVNVQLFEWVVENIIKNAIDAMDGKGNVSVSLSDAGKYAIIDVQDSGKGIARNKFKTIFTAGYTTKPRGWGLGLSLAKRIVSEYHKGKIFVKSSELGKGTVIRIQIPK